MFCSKCGAQLQDDQAYCGQCGQKSDFSTSPPSPTSVTTTEALLFPEREQPQTEDEAKKELNTTRFLMLALTVAVLLILFVLFGVPAFLIGGDWSFSIGMGVMIGVGAIIGVAYTLYEKGRDKLDEKTSGGFSDFLSLANELGIKIVVYLIMGAFYGFLITVIVSILVNIVFGSFGSSVSDVLNEFFWIPMVAGAIINLAAMLFQDFIEKRNASRNK